MKFWQKVPVFFFGLMYPSKIYGKENIPEGGAVLVCNHFKAIDCGFMVKAYDKDVYFLAKNELFKNKLFARLIKSYGAIPIDRQNPDMKSLLAAIRVLKDGHKLAIYPEGTRNKTGSNELQEIKGGTVVFAVKAKCPIVPIMMLKKPKIFSKTKIIVGKPFTLEEFYGQKLTDEVIEQMGNLVRSKMIEQQQELIKLTTKKQKGKNNENTCR